MKTTRAFRFGWFFLLVFSVGGVAFGQPVRQPVLDGEQRLAWHQTHLQMRDASPYKKMKWRHIGPTNMSGRVTDLAVPEDQPFTFYVATASGGVWKTTNEGTTWQAIFDDAPSGSVGAISVAPSDSNTIWVGLGEANIFRSSMAGTGVYKSTDAGETWTSMGLVDSHHIARIVVHPTDNNIVYVAASGHEYTPSAERGVYKSIDGGAHWTRVLFEDEMTGAIDLVMHPTDPNTLYASMWHRIRRPWSDPVPGPGGGVYKTTDAGKTWTLLEQGLPKRGNAGRTGIAISRSNPEVVYALVDNHEIARAAEKGETDAYGRPRKGVIKGAQVYRSNDGGSTWECVSENNDQMTRVFSTYGWVFGQIRVDPNDENTIFVMGVPLIKSTDGGKTFKSCFFSGLHGDHHAMWIDPKNSNHIINGNDGGVNISYDGGLTWKNDERLPVVQFYNVAIDNAKPFNVYGSIQDNMSWRGPSNFRPFRDRRRWETIPGGEASHFAIDPEDPNIFYSEGFYGNLMRSTLSPRQTKRIRPRAKKGEAPLRGQWLAPFILSPHNSRVVYHGMQSVHRSMDRGENWEQISPDLTYNDPDRRGNISYATISSISESPFKFGRIYVGTDDGRVHVTHDGGKTWEQIMAGLPQRKWVSRIIASKFDPDTVYLTQNGKRDNDFQVYVYRSRDCGKNWEDISSGIPGGPVNVIHEDPVDQNILYVGTDMGVYVTTDGAETWNVLGSGLPITFVHDLVVHPRDHVAVIATHGRGMFTLKVESLRKKEKPKSAEEKEAKAETGN